MAVKTKQKCRSVFKALDVSRISGDAIVQRACKEHRKMAAGGPATNLTKRVRVGDMGRDINPENRAYMTYNLRGFKGKLKVDSSKKEVSLNFLCKTKNFECTIIDKKVTFKDERAQITRSQMLNFYKPECRRRNVEQIKGDSKYGYVINYQFHIISNKKKNVSMRDLEIFTNANKWSFRKKCANIIYNFPTTAPKHTNMTRAKNHNTNHTSSTGIKMMERKIIDIRKIRVSKVITFWTLKI